MKKLFLTLFLLKFILVCHAQTIVDPKIDLAVKTGYIISVQTGYFHEVQVTAVVYTPDDQGDVANVLMCGDVTGSFRNVSTYDHVVLVYRRASASRKTGCHELKMFQILPEKH